MQTTLTQRLGRSTIALAAATVLAAILAVAAWHAGNGAQQRDEAGRDSVPAATAAAKAIFSYDYRGFDAAVANGKSFTTGSFTGEYTQTTATLKDSVLAEHAVVRAEVSAVGVVEPTADRVEVLLYINQYRTNANITGEKVDQNRVVLTMLLTDEGWKVLHATAI
jgi:Mce-associated membrane protein